MRHLSSRRLPAGFDSEHLPLQLQRVSGRFQQFTSLTSRLQARSEPGVGIPADYIPNAHPQTSRVESCRAHIASGNLNRIDPMSSADDDDDSNHGVAIHSPWQPPFRA
jgi:hypothetical protein